MKNIINLYLMQPVQVLFLLFSLFVLANSSRKGLILYRYGGSVQPKITMSGKTLVISKSVWPQYQKEEFLIEGDDSSPLQITFSDFGGTLSEFQMPSGWIWSSDTEQAFREGADFFYFINGNLNYISRTQYSRLYDQVGRPQFHFSAPLYWINDPNGFASEQYDSNGVQKTRYHLSYQYDPFNLQDSGLLFWGHAISDDLIYWRHLPAVLFPDKAKLTSEFKSGGIFSGGALQNSNKLYRFYTDHFETNSQFIESQYVEVDGLSKNIIDSSQKPVGASNDFRDPAPSVNINTKRFNLLMGTAVNSVPSIVQYSSLELTSGWVFDSVIYSGTNLPSTTIECPNKFYMIDSATKVMKTVLVFSINDIKIGSSYTLYVVGEEDSNGVFKNATDIQRLDYGNHFYATQILTQSTQQQQQYESIIAVTWMQNWNIQGQYLGNQYFSGVMTIARQMTLKNNQLFQEPVTTISNLRKQQVSSESLLSPYHAVRNVPETSEILLTVSQVKAELELTIRFYFTNSKTSQISLSFSQNLFTMVVYEETNTELKAPVFQVGETMDLRILLDRSAIEIFGNGGEVAFSQRFLQGTKQEDVLVTYTANSQIKLQVWQLGKLY